MLRQEPSLMVGLVPALQTVETHNYPHYFAARTFR